MQNFRTLGQQEKSNSSGEKRERREKTRQREERKMTEKNAANSGHYDLPATSKGCTRTSSGPIQFNYMLGTYLMYANCVIINHSCLGSIS